MKNQKYSSAVEGILKVSTEEALDHVREIRSNELSDACKILEQKLISFRLAIKIGNATYLDQEELSVAHADTDFLKAETHFVRGVILIHKEQFSRASEELLNAAKLYIFSHNDEKSMLSRFNALIAKANGGLISDQTELSLCNEILLEAVSKSVPKIQALCLRQKSYLYFIRGQYIAALNEIKEALPLIESHCPVSDYHLALIHATDCALEAQDTSQMQLYWDYLPRELDSRLDFPKAYIEAKKNKKEVDLSMFPNPNSHWRERYGRYVSKRQEPTLSQKPRFTWNQQTGWFTNDKKQLLGKIKSQSLEGHLIKVLIKGPQSKELLCEVLWPEFASLESLDDRFFRLKNRINQKLGLLIFFDGRIYSLTAEIVRT